MQESPLFHRAPTRGLSPQQRHLLSRVSRSFDLSIRLLPPAVQGPVAIGYLLARATDTVADTSTLPLPERQVLLEVLSSAIAQDRPNEKTQYQLARLTRQFAAQQSQPHERALMQALPECLPLLATLAESDRGLVRKVLALITQGQALDMTRFGNGLQALNTEQELDHYTWLVAGCVGEFWTDLCIQHLPDFSCLPADEMLSLGRQYGMGLQRLNILRDAHEDLAAGRCYWPRETLSTAGLTPPMLAELASTGHAETLQRIAPLYDAWLDHTHSQLEAGMRYAMALKPWRLRLASALPALIGAKTLALLREKGPVALTTHIKMSRRELRGLLWQVALGWGSPARLGHLFEKLSSATTG